MTPPVYLDYMSTTPMATEVVEAMSGYMGIEGQFGNPASNTHVFGDQAALAVKRARQQVANLVGATPREIIWTSGATEANNLAIIGAARFHARSGRHLITVKTEHKAVLDSFAYLEKNGFSVTYLEVDAQGLLDYEQLEAAITPETILLSVMHVNNETGVIQDINRIGQIARSRHVLFHVDAAQSAGKCPIDLANLPVDMMSFSAHKIYGPKGVGALYVQQQPRIRIEPLIHGGGHEWGLRSGTLPTHQIVGMGRAFALAESRFGEDDAHLKKLADVFCNGLSVLRGVRVLANNSPRFTGCFNLYFEELEAETLLAALPEFACSTGSACNAAKAVPSHVLLAMGLSRLQASHCVRFSFGRYTRVEEVDRLVTSLQRLTNR